MRFSRKNYKESSMKTMRYLLLVLVTVTFSNIQAAAAKSSGSGEKDSATGRAAPSGTMTAAATKVAQKTYAQSVGWFVTEINKTPFEDDSKNATQAFAASVLAEYDKRMTDYRREAFERQIILDLNILDDRELITALRAEEDPSCSTIHTMLLCLEKLDTALKAIKQKGTDS